MYGAFDIDSMPPVTTTSASPARIIESAICTARTDDAQTLLTASAGVSTGNPAPIAACRAGSAFAPRARRPPPPPPAPPPPLPRRRLPRTTLQHLPQDHVVRLTDTH